MTRETARYTYIDGSSHGSAVVYDDDTKIHNHSDTNPSRGQQSAFDLTRIHKFSHLDKDAGELPIAERPSHKAMIEFAEALPEIRAQRAASEFENLGPLPAPAVNDNWLETPPASRFRVIEAAELVTLGLEEPEWLVDEVIPRYGIGMFFGASGSHKTTCVLDLMAAHHRGVRWRDRATTKGRGVIVCAEGERNFKFHVMALAKNLKCDISELPAVVPSPVNLMNGEQVKELCGELKKLGAAHLCFDTKQMCSVGADENAVKEQSVIAANMKFLARELNAFVSTVHHTGHGDQTRARGSSIWQPAVDAEFSLKFDNAQKAGTMECTKLKEGPRGTVYSFGQKIIELGVSKKSGKPYGSVVIEHTDAPKRTPRAATKLSGTNQKAVEPAIQSFSTILGTPVDLDKAIEVALKHTGLKAAEIDRAARKKMKKVFFNVRNKGRITIDVEANTCRIGNVIAGNEKEPESRAQA